MKKIILFLLISILIQQVNAQVPNYLPTNGLIGWWPFNGNANDESGSGKDGNVFGAVLSNDRFGNNNSSYHFTTDQQIIISNSQNLNTFPLTISLWYNSDTIVSGNIFTKYQSGFWNGFGIGQGGDAVFPFYLRNTSDRLIGNYYGEEPFQSNIVLNTWFHIVFTADSLEGKLYVNGVLLDTHPWTGQSGPSSNQFPWKIGGQWDDWFNGYVDDIAVWNQILTSTEINNLYNASSAKLKFFADGNNNCLQEQNESPLEGFIVNLNPGNYFFSTNSGGVVNLENLSDGNYSFSVGSNSGLWSYNCLSSGSFQISNGSMPSIEIGVSSNDTCSNPDISIYAPILRPCIPNQIIYISACNQTTAVGVLNDSYVDVELDPLINITGASLPYFDLGNNNYRFQTGTLNPGDCINFNIIATIGSPDIDCSSINGQTLCMEANLFPVQLCALDTVPSDPIINDGTGGTLNGFPQPCTLPWDQSSLSVDGWCANDSIYFTITNTGEPGGGDMECYSPMWITVDGVVTYTDSILITGGQTITLAYPGDGATWILNAEQHPLHPGNSHPNAHVEACGDTTNLTPDDVNDFPQDDADPVVDIYCGVVTGSYDPNDKTGYPIGQTNQKYIQPNQQLQYVIRFQNTGTDTAFTVVIRDTLDTDLNIFTVTSGVSSHQYDFRMYGPRVLEWTFNNILLPDSTTNSDGSNGFVTFHVDQVPNLAPGTEITNDADIYFDFNDPITTNTTMHRIYEGFVNVLNIEDLTQEGKSLLIYPNPTSNIITIQGKEDMHQNFKIFDQMGREVYKGKLNGITTDVYLTNLSKGIYTLKIDGNYKPAQIVKE
jgi:uncharacterized repeat protein (TIGR01451 family)